MLTTMIARTEKSRDNDTLRTLDQGMLTAKESNLNSLDSLVREQTSLEQTKKLLTQHNFYKNIKPTKPGQTNIDAIRASYQELRAGQVSNVKVSSHDAALRTNEGIRFRGNQAERVMEAMKNNELCESSPTALHKGSTQEKLMDLRPRDRSLELDGDFRFKPRSTFEKFADKISINASNSIKTDEIFSKHIKNDNKRPLLALKKNLDFIGKESMASALSQ